MSETPTKKTLASLVALLLSSLVAAIGVHRTDADAIAKQKADSDEHIKALQDRIKELEEGEADETEIEGLRGQIEDALTQAQAAKPPTDEHVAEVEAIEPATGDAPVSGADATGNTEAK